MFYRTQEYTVLQICPEVYNATASVYSLQWMQSDLESVICLYKAMHYSWETICKFIQFTYKDDLNDTSTLRTKLHILRNLHLPFIKKTHSCLQSKTLLCGGQESVLTFKLPVYLQSFLTICDSHWIKLDNTAYVCTRSFFSQQLDYTSACRCSDCYYTPSNKENSPRNEWMISSRIMEGDHRSYVSEENGTHGSHQKGNRGDRCTCVCSISWSQLLSNNSWYMGKSARMNWV